MTTKKLPANPSADATRALSAYQPAVPQRSVIDLEPDDVHELVATLPVPSPWSGGLVPGVWMIAMFAGLPPATWAWAMFAALPVGLLLETLRALWARTRYFKQARELGLSAEDAKGLMRRIKQLRFSRRTGGFQLTRAQRDAALAQVVDAVVAVLKDEKHALLLKAAEPTP